MHIISINGSEMPENKGYLFSGIIDGGDYYATYHSSPGNSYVCGKILKSEYKEPEHIVEVLRAWRLCEFFLKDPIEISSLDYENIISALRQKNIEI